MEKQDNSDAVQILEMFGPVNTLTAEGCSKIGPFKHLTSHLFWSQQFRKYLSYETHLFFFQNT